MTELKSRELLTVVAAGGKCGSGEAGPMVCLESVSVDDQSLTLALSYRGFSPSIGSGMHAHVYPGSQKLAGVGTGGIWQVIDQPVWEVPIADPMAKEILASGTVCVATEYRKDPTTPWFTTWCRAWTSTNRTVGGGRWLAACSIFESDQ